VNFTKAIVRKPGPEIIKAITTAEMGEPDFDKANIQHSVYVETLESLGVEVTVLEADPQYPDGCFVEDTAVVTERCAIIDNPGAPSRKGEITAIEEALRGFYTQMEHICVPGTLEGGDVLRIEDDFYIGLSSRTNMEGANQLIQFLHKYDYTGVMVPMKEMLHLKTGLAYLENNVLLTAGEFVNHQLFHSFQEIIVEENEAYAANCIWINGSVLIPYGFPHTQDAIHKAGFSTIPLDTSEYQKLDGGLSCLSLRF
jgi:dimethylargininase